MYIFIGILVGLLNIIILFISTEYLGIYYIYSAIISLFIGNVIKFILNKIWTFNEKIKHKFVNGFVWFMAIGLFTIILNIILLYIFTDFLRIYYVLSQLISLMIVGLLGFYLNDMLTFNRKK